jgi:hypothetical protein
MKQFKWESEDSRILIPGSPGTRNVIKIRDNLTVQVGIERFPVVQIYKQFVKSEYIGGGGLLMML